MMKVKYSSEISIKNGRITKSRVINIDDASDDELLIIGQIKPIMNTWIKSKILERVTSNESVVFIKCKYLETTNGVSIQFKVQGAIKLARNT